MKHGFLFLMMLVTFSMSVFNVRFKSQVSDEFKESAVYAFSLMDGWLNISCTINVDIATEDFLSADTYARGVFGYHCDHPTHNPYTLIPASLYTHLSHCNYCKFDSDTAHIHIYVNNNVKMPLFYFKTDQRVPYDHVDFITLLLHEMMHGLGFVSGFTTKDGVYGFYPSFYLYDTFIFKIEPRLIAPSPLADNSILTGENLMFRDQNNSFPVYAPKVFSASSLSHTSRSNALMYYKVFQGRAIHCLTSECVIFFDAMGYPLKNNVSACEVSSSSTMDWFIDFFI